jgi:alpha-L-rhamnosidase
LLWDWPRKKIQEALFQRLVDNLCTSQGPVFGVGLIGIQWQMRELTRRGRVDVAYDLATRTEYPSWGYMLKHGATTLWELWNGDTAQPFMNSGNHIMLTGDLHLWMFECLGGIQPDVMQPGFKHILLHPHFVPALDTVTVAHDTMHGCVRSHWEKFKQHVCWDISIPSNTTATLKLERVEPTSLQICGPEATRVTASTIKIGPGNYRVEGNC